MGYKRKLNLVANIHVREEKRREERIDNRQAYAELRERERDGVEKMLPGRDISAIRPSGINFLPWLALA